MNQPPRPVRLLQISDTHCYADDTSLLEWSHIPVQPNLSLQRLLKHLAKRACDYDALIVSGDLVQEETAETYQRIKEILEQFPLPVYVLPGNHDVPDLMLTHLRPSANIRFLPYVQIGSWHCLFLDTSQPNKSDGHLEADALAALEQQLSALPEDEYAIIFMHHHPVPIGSLWMDSMGLQQTEAFWSLLSRFPQVKATCFGHIHHAFQSSYNTGHKHPIAIYGTPATCVQLGHNGVDMVLEHTDPAWRDLILRPNGRVDTQVSYLPLISHDIPANQADCAVST